MSLLKVTASSLSQTLGQAVPEVYVVVAKHLALGVDESEICKLIDCTSQELQELQEDSLYKAVRAQVGMAHAESASSQTTSWDYIEEQALQNLSKRVEFEKDTDMLLRIAAVANKAQRKIKPQENLLDPANRQGRTAITLTRRLIHKITHAGPSEMVEEQQIRITDGSAVNPSFEEVDSMLGVTQNQGLPKVKRIETHDADPSWDELDQVMRDKGF